MSKSGYLAAQELTEFFLQQQEFFLEVGCFS